MKQLLHLLLMVPLFTAAQQLPRFEHDTLYTSCGYKIYAGQTLQFGKATGKGGKFNYVTIRNGVSAASLENNTVVVKELGNFSIPSVFHTNIDIRGYTSFRDSSKGYVNLLLNFDYAIGNLYKVPGELIVPEAFQYGSKAHKLLYIPRFDNDTLYTSCGYKIYKGQLLQFGKATSERDRFLYVNIKNNVPPAVLQNHSIRVTALGDFDISNLGNGYITVTGILVINDNDRGDIVVHMAFDRAIENLPGIPSELVVADKFRNRMKIMPEQEIERLQRLKSFGIISNEELEVQKKRLREQ